MIKFSNFAPDIPYVYNTFSGNSFIKPRTFKTGEAYLKIPKKKM